MVVAHSERATLRVGEVFLKVDAVPGRLDREVAAMALAPVPTADVLWHRPPVLALAAPPGTPLGRLGVPSTASAAAWAAVGAVVRTLHRAPLPPWTGRGLADRAASLDTECRWLVDRAVLPAGLVAHGHDLAQAALRPSEPVFAHGDLQVDHVFVDGDRVTGLLDWSEAGQGDGLHDLASLTLGQRDRLDDLLAGYGTDVDVEAIRGWWALRSLSAIRWLQEHGFDPFAPGCEVDVLRSL